MISTITILGKALDPIKNFEQFRHVEIESREPFEEKSFYSKIPVMYWDRSKGNNPLLNIPTGCLMVIFGRLERHPQLGLYVLAEQIRHFPSNLEK
ncbi:MAG TPA: hypothetical protein GX010_02390 [Erysipelotrichaceae bacterium]|nr:hypothetical protein [Erysipelotrichaceae bacterium]